MDRMSQGKNNHELDILPSEVEVRKAIKQMSCCKAPGTDAIPSEIYKEGGPTVIQ